MEAVIISLLICAALFGYGYGCWELAKNLSRDKQISTLDAFYCCVFLSPLFGALIIITRPNKVAPKKKCRWCQLDQEPGKHYCPRCLKDDEGYTMEQNAERFEIIFNKS